MTISGQTSEKKKQTSSQSKRRSTNGLTSTEICEIIDACGRNNIRHFGYGDLEFVLNGEVALTPRSKLYNQPEFVPNVDIGREMSDNDDDIEIEQDVVDLENLALSDPVSYENYLQVSEG